MVISFTGVGRNMYDHPQIVENVCIITITGLAVLPYFTFSVGSRECCMYDHPQVVKIVCRIMITSHAGPSIFRILSWDRECCMFTNFACRSVFPILRCCREVGDHSFQLLIEVCMIILFEYPVVWVLVRHYCLSVSTRARERPMPARTSLDAGAGATDFGKHSAFLLLGGEWGFF